VDKDTLRQAVMLVFTSIVLYFSGLYLMTIGKIKNINDGLIVMTFFFAVFPFLSCSAMLTIKFFKFFLSPKKSQS
jgi:hypothetical protein